MAYSSLAEVKEILRIAVLDTDHDAEITICITTADGWIDNELKEFESSLPLSPVSTPINTASKYKAAALFRERSETEQDITEWQRFEKRAENALERYIQKTYFQGGIKS